MAFSKQEYDEFLNTEEICFIATTQINGDPHVVPIWFIFHAGKVYFETDTDTKKFKNIKNHNKVWLCFGGKDTLILQGTVAWKEEDELDFPIRKMYHEKYKDKMKDSYINENTLIFELDVERSFSWHY